MRSWFPRLGYVGAAALLIAVGMTFTPYSLVSRVAHSGSARDEPTYLGAAADQIAHRVPPPPQGAAVIEADRKVFVATRALEGSWRWHQAARDANHSPRALLSAFSCASGVQLTPERAPRLAALLTAAGADGARVASQAKASFERARPYALYGGPICRNPDRLGASRDYPSGHSARGWSWGLVLAELIPDRREQLSSRAEAYAESRVVCGFHSPTGADAGRAVADLTFDALMRNPAFRADLEQAANELASLKRDGQAPPAQQCRSEQGLSHRPY